MDSVTCQKSGVIKNGAKLADIGSGAGLPGIPLKILNPKLKLWLIESAAKKCKFLQSIVEKLAISNAVCLCERAEVIGADTKFRAAFDVTTARAVADLAVALEYAIPLLKVNGMHIAQTGLVEETSLKKYEKVAAMLGADLNEVIPIEIPGVRNRSLIIFKKRAETPAIYPRRPGVPKKRPLSVI